MLFIHYATSVNEFVVVSTKDFIPTIQRKKVCLFSEREQQYIIILLAFPLTAHHM
jgi:hypothetical protein